MAHSYVSSLFHIVFSTKQRIQLIPPDHQSRLWNYLAGIARNYGMQVLAVGGTENTSIYSWSSRRTRHCPTRYGP